MPLPSTCHHVILRGGGGPVRRLLPVFAARARPVLAPTATVDMPPPVFAAAAMYIFSTRGSSRRREAPRLHPIAVSRRRIHRFGCVAVEIPAAETDKVSAQEARIRGSSLWHPSPDPYTVPSHAKCDECKAAYDGSLSSVGNHQRMPRPQWHAMQRHPPASRRSAETNATSLPNDGGPSGHDPGQTTRTHK